MARGLARSRPSANWMPDPSGATTDRRARAAGSPAAARPRGPRGPERVPLGGVEREERPPGPPREWVGPPADAERRHVDAIEPVLRRPPAMAVVVERIAEEVEVVVGRSVTGGRGVLRPQVRHRPPRRVRRDAAAMGPVAI